MRKAAWSACVLAAWLAAPAIAADGPAYLGAWVVKSSQVAPWASPDTKPVQSDLKALIGKRVVFEAKRIVAPPPLTCRYPNYEMKVYTPDLLFQGSLNDPDRQAAALGFHAPIKTLETGCAGAFDFHFLDANTAMFGLNNRLYRMERVGK